MKADVVLDEIWSIIKRNTEKHKGAVFEPERDGSEY